MSCRDLMHRSISACSPDDTLSSCAEVVRNQSIPLLVVLDRDQRAIGVLTREALLEAIWRHSGELVRDIMSTQIATCRPELAPEAVARLLLHSGAPVAFVKDGDELLGWITPHDLAEVTHVRPLLARKRGHPEVAGHRLP